MSVPSYAKVVTWTTITRTSESGPVDFPDARVLRETGRLHEVSHHLSTKDLSDLIKTWDYGMHCGRRSRNPEFNAGSDGNPWQSSTRP